MLGNLLKKLGKIINVITLLIVVGLGTIIHTLTALTLKSYYGDPWGYVSFMFPGFSEAYLVAIQLGDDMYNYTILLSVFLCLTFFWLITRFFGTKLFSTLENQS